MPDMTISNDEVRHVARLARLALSEAELDRIGGQLNDILAAVGRPGTIAAAMVKPGAAVVDVGINRTDAGLVGDVDAAVAEVAGLLTPVPGGVGPMTIAMLLRNTIRAARYRRGNLAFPK